MACVPGLALAEDNAGIQYETDVPKPPGQESSNIPSDKNSGGSPTGNEPDAEASDTDPGTGGVAGGQGGSSTGGGANTGQGNQATGGGDGQRAGGSDRAGGNLDEAKPISSFGEATSAQSEDDSSPLVPILIAVALLAAISIGAYLYRQRRQDPSSPVSPKAS